MTNIIIIPVWSFESEICLWNYIPSLSVSEGVFPVVFIRAWQFGVVCHQMRFSSIPLGYIILETYIPSMFRKNSSILVSLMF